LQSLNEGLASVLYPIEEQLICYIFKLRECGMAVSLRLVIIKAAALCREFKDSANCSVCHHPLVYSMSWFGSSYGHKNLPVASKRIGDHSYRFHGINSSNGS